MKNEQSRAPARGWVKKALCSGVVLAMSVAATSAVAGNKKGEEFNEFTPVSRIAQIPVVRDEKGHVDYKASYAWARAASVAVATYVARMREYDSVGPEIEGKDWKLGGTSEDCISDSSTCTNLEIDEAVLKIPSPDPIDPNDPAGFNEDGTVTKANTKKANVLDFCNKKYASLAMGVAPIIDDKYVVNGYSHAPALPCEVSIWLDDNKINVDMLNPEAIFTLFFSDVLFSEEMQDKDFADELNAMTVKVNNEIRATIYAALTYHGYDHTVVDKEVGPVYGSMKDIINVVASSTYQSPYKHMSYTRGGGGTFTAKESKAVAQTIINTLSTHEDSPGVHPTIINEITGETLDSILSPNSSWRSARIAPISIPGKNHIIEACSPKYAKMAMSTGLSHVNALPCEITVNTIDGGNKLVVSYLDPDFMLKSLFADISNKDKKEFGDIPGIIMTDLQNVVKAALDNVYVDNEDGTSYPLTFDPGVQISYDMLPQE